MSRPRAERVLLTEHWVVDPVSRRAGVATIEVHSGKVARLEWRDGIAEARRTFIEGGEPGVKDPKRLVLPALIDLHAHFRQPGSSASEDVASGEAAAAHGGYGAVALMPNSEPAADHPALLRELTRSAAPRGLTLMPIAAATLGRAGGALSPMAELAAAGAVAFSDDGSPIADPARFRSALITAGALGLPLIEHCEDPGLTKGGEAADGLVATALGLQPWPAAGEISAVVRNIALLRDAARDEPRVRLHLTHLSTAQALDAVRAARAEGLPITCDITPHHFSITDAWIAGDQRWAWEYSEKRPAALTPTADAYNTNLRVCPPLRNAGDAAACRAALRDGTASAIATDHAPHSRDKKEVEFGLAANGIAGIETALSTALAARAAGEFPLSLVAALFTTGPAAVLNRPALARGLAVGGPANLLVVDLAATWVPTRKTLVGRSINTPLLGRSLPGVVLMTLLNGEVAWKAE
ncbi:MAG: dihydroorotase [Candidatus Limnocylindrus sp.]